MFRQKCEDCGKVWNAAFGVVGVTQIAAPPTKCPGCGSEKIVFHAHGWAMEDGSIMPQQQTVAGRPD